MDTVFLSKTSAMLSGYFIRFCLSFADVEDLLAERGIVVSLATIRNWCNKFGPASARSIKKRLGSPGDTG